jgi:hypothetical protein
VYVEERRMCGKGVCVGKAYVGDPGLFHFVALRPYHGTREMQKCQKTVIYNVGAQCNEVE